MAWKKGESGNPNGKPKTVLADGRSLRDMAREYTQEALDALIKVLRDEEAPAASRVSAAQTIHDRGWGKPTQPIAGDSDMPPLNWGKAPDEVVAWMAAQALADDAPTAH